MTTAPAHRGPTAPDPADDTWFVGRTTPRWSVPLLARDTGATREQRAALARLVLDRTAAAPSGAAVTHAAKSPPDLLRDPDSAVAAVRGWIEEAARALGDHTGVPHRDDLVAEAWGLVCATGGTHHIHAHHDALWSGVLYVHTGEPGSGLVQFLDPRPAACARETQRDPVHSITPFPGLLLAWPAWVPHWVTPHRGDQPRISIAFNIGIPRI